ncbi:MAG: hypothetical protein QOJ29_1771 [Thermoleophilaceae bacterium]|nr:hypothetical protein [Thermoleophilaceae bacterium]
MLSPTPTRAPVDHLSHDELAQAILGYVADMPPGSVVAVQAPWGRGKTDVLARVHARYVKRASTANAPEPLWLNPWRYGSPNLIAPLVIELLGPSRLKPEARKGNERLRAAARTLLRAGNAVAFKALSVVVPFGEILQAGKEPVDELIGQLFEQDGAAPPVDLDPVASMADRFRELIDEYLTVTKSEHELVICVDDLDRCLPDHQIAMLEAIHFLTSSGARAYFVIALDPTLAQQAAVSHYAGLGFDTNQYLDKIFDLRINLRALRRDTLARLVDHGLARELTVSGHWTSAGVALAQAVGVQEPEFREICRASFYLPELTNPRFIARALWRLALVASANVQFEVPQDSKPYVTNSHVAQALVRLVVLSERWPAVRSLLQASDQAFWQPNLEYFASSRGFMQADWSEADIVKAANRPGLAVRLPDAKQHPDLGEFLDGTLKVPEVGTLFYEIDQKLLAVGL